MPDRPFKSLLSDPSFVKLWLSQALSQLTIQLVNFSILTRVFEVTKSTVAVAMFMAWLFIKREGDYVLAHGLGL